MTERPPDPARAARYLLALLFDPSEREAFAADREGAMAAYGLSASQAASFKGVSLPGLQADAQGRERYLMSAMCRVYPLSTGAIGSTATGPEALVAFLASPSLLAGAAARNLAFGAHLERLLSLDALGLGPGVSAFLAPFLAWERALVDNATRVRQATARGEHPPTPMPAAEAGLDHPLRLPPALIAASLPCSPELLRGALHGLRPEDAWVRIRGRDLSPSRVRAVARAAAAGTALPVLVLARALITRQSGEVFATGPGPRDPAPDDPGPLVEVSHRTVELWGEQIADATEVLRDADGRPMGALPPRLQGVARALLQAGLLD